MKRETYILLAVGISLLVLTSTAGAQQEQWLQYHSEREARLIMPEAGITSQEVATNKPQGVNLPQFKTQQPYFVRWSTPMVESGGLWIALDSTSEMGERDLLYIDSNGNGHLDDEEPVKAYQTDQLYTYFGPVKVLFDVEGEPVTYHLNFRFYEYNNRNRRLYIYSGGWYEGDVTVAGEKKYCVLIDHNVNGTFNDKSFESSQCDRIRLGIKGARDTGWVGNYVKVDDVLYNIEVSRDGAFVKLARAEGVKFGSVRVPETITRFSVGGENGLFSFEPEKGVGSLPVGNYLVDSWVIERKDAEGKNWQLTGVFFRGKGVFTVSEDSVTALDIGEPVTATLRANLNGDNYEFSKSLQGSMGEYVRLTSEGRDIDKLWKMKAKNKAGTYEKLFPIPDQ